MRASFSGYRLKHAFLRTIGGARYCPQDAAPEQQGKIAEMALRIIESIKPTIPSAGEFDEKLKAIAESLARGGILILCWPFRWAFMLCRWLDPDWHTHIDSDGPCPACGNRDERIQYVLFGSGVI
jgi:hypothetical protein